MDGILGERPLSTRTRISLAIARGFAAARGDVDVTATHILWGLLKEGDNGASRVLQHAGVSLATIGLELEAELGPKGNPRPRQVVVDSTEGEQAILRQADQEAQLRGDPFLGVEHLLLAILIDRESGASRILERQGLSLENGRTYINQVTGRGG